MIKGIHHTGFAVKDLEESIKFFSSLGFQLENKFENPTEKAKACFMKLGGDSIEMWEFQDESTDFAKVVKKHTGFETDYIEKDIKDFLSQGYSIAIPVKEGISVKKYLFLKDKNNNYIELLEV